jgi:hypothetical protein
MKPMRSFARAVLSTAMLPELGWVRVLASAFIAFGQDNELPSCRRLNYIQVSLIPQAIWAQKQQNGL